MLKEKVMDIPEERRETMRSQAEIEALKGELEDLTDKIHDLPVNIYYQVGEETGHDVG